jgi:VWFA-related protein
MMIRHLVKKTAQPRVRDFGRRPAAGHRLGLVLLVFALFLAADQPLRSQQAKEGQAQGPPITVHVKVVNVLATVRDKKGAIVRDLTQNDFELTEDDRPQTIRYFSHETDLPLTLGLLVDTSMSQRRVLGEERDASATFLDQVLRVDKDQAFVIHFDKEVELLQDLTSSRQKLQAAIGLLQVPQRSDDERGDSPDSGQEQGGQRGQGGGRGRGGWGGGTTLYDAIYLASNDITAKQGGRKALIVLSDGVDRGSKKTLASAIEAAQRADTLVYSILFAEEPQSGGGGYGGHHGGWGGGGMGGGMGGGGGHHGGGYPRQQESRPDGKKILERLSKETGGRFFEVSKKHPVDETFSQIQEEMRNQYSLGYTPEPPDAGPGYHKIILTTKKKDLSVQARDGYYSGN